MKDVRLRPGDSIYCYCVADAIAYADPGLRAACEKMTQSEGGLLGDLTTVEEMVGRWRP